MILWNRSLGNPLANKLAFHLCQVAVLLATAGCLFPQSVESVPFRAVLSGPREVPTTFGLTARATVWLRLVRDANLRLTNASVDLDLRHNLPADAKITAVKLFEGPPTGTGGLLLDFGPLPSRDSSREGNVLHLKAAIDASQLRILATPQPMYLAMETADIPGPTVRGALEAADLAILLSPLNPTDVTQTARGLGAVHLLATRDRAGRVTSSEIVFDIDYESFSPAAQVIGARLNAGGGNEIALALATRPAPAGAGNFRLRIEVPLALAATNTVAAMLRNPRQVTLELITSADGRLSGRLHGTDRITFLPRAAVSSVPPVSPVSPVPTAPTRLAFHTLRDQTGDVTAAIAVVDPAPDPTPDPAPDPAPKAAFTAIVTDPQGRRLLNRALDPAAPFTFFNLAEVASLNALLQSPDKASLQIQTGEPVALAMAALPPVVETVISAVWDPRLTAIAPGGLFTVFGRHLAKVSGDLAGLVGNRIPLALNGTSLTIAGRAAPLIDVQPDRVIAQVPTDLPPGRHPVRIRTREGESAAVMTTVAAAAPAVFFQQTTREGNVAVVHKGNGTVVSPENPARPSEVLIFFSTGFGGRTLPAIGTGVAAPFEAPVRTTVPMVTIGGRQAPSVYSVLVPGLIGIVQTAVRMPAAAGNGNLPLVVTIGQASSSPVLIFGALR